MEGSNVQHANAPTNMILSTLMGIFHGLNCLGYMIYVSQTRTYQNFAKLLTRLSIFVSWPLLGNKEESQKFITYNFKDFFQKCK